MENDESSEVVGTTIEALTYLIEKLGPACVDQKLDEYAELINKLLEGRCAC